MHTQGELLGSCDVCRPSYVWASETSVRQLPEKSCAKLFFFFNFPEVDMFFSACFVCSTATSNENAKEFRRVTMLYRKSPNCKRGRKVGERVEGASHDNISVRDKIFVC